VTNDQNRSESAFMSEPAVLGFVSVVSVVVGIMGMVVVVAVGAAGEVDVCRSAKYS
jgi:hypothetical protein